MTTADFRNDDAIIAATRRAMVNLVPPPEMLPSMWAEANVKIPVGNAIPGPISFDNAPYQRGMLDAIKEPGVYRVDYMTGAQLGKTTVQQCITGYFIAHEPRSQMFAQPTQGDMQTFLETKLRPMLDANPTISSKMAKQRGRDGVNNSRIISYVGGWMMMSWSGSPKTARGRSAPVIQQDEVDGYEATPEGDFCELLSQRNATFGDQRLETRSSTPTIKGASRIETGYNEGDGRRYFVPCPDCHEPQYLHWRQVKWNGRLSTEIKDAELDLNQDHDPTTATYVCEHCGSCWDDGQRITAIRTAEAQGHGWKSTRPYTGHISFHAPEILSTFRRLREIVQSYLAKLAQGDLQSFVNVSLAETFEETGEKADADSLFKRQEVWAAQVPAGGLVLTSGIDMQIDRLEVETVAWGHGEESWSVDYTVLWGDPLGAEVWNDLVDYLAGTFQHASGAELPISSACLDTGGTAGYTQAAYDFARGKTGRRLFAVKGGGTWGSPVVAAPTRRQSGKAKRKVDLFIVGVDEAKVTVMRRLAQQVVGPGYCHFAEGRDEEYFKQLTAEKLLTRYVKGFPVREWHAIRKRNEALDCRVYAYAALKILNPPMKRLAERLKMPETAVKLAEIAPKTAEIVPKTAQKPPSVAVKKSAEVARVEAQIAPEIPPQEKKAAKPDTKPIKRSAMAKKRGGWVNNW
jgi:phage terminase large subunit GpA-like protein